MIIFILLVYAYSLLSRRLENTIFGIPQVFTLAGIVLAWKTPEMANLDMRNNVWLILAEITFAIVVFNEATRVHLRTLKGQLQLPGRLPILGLPLTILLGMLVAWLDLPSAW